jgi:hypothetical protein
MSIAEIAGETGESVAAVKSRLHRTPDGTRIPDWMSAV